MRSLMLAAVAALAFATAASAARPAQGPYHLDSNGKCRAAGGQLVLARLCYGSQPKHCKDPKTHRSVRCGTPGAVPA